MEAERLEVREEVLTRARAQPVEQEPGESRQLFGRAVGV
jgi:hypothetical protein